MTVLLDTHALLWWLSDDARLTPPARTVMSDIRNTILMPSPSSTVFGTNPPCVPEVPPMSSMNGQPLRCRRLPT